MTTQQCIFILGLIVSIPAKAASISPVWPAGQDICTGEWSYDQIQECEKEDFNNPIFENTGEFARLPKTCEKWSFGREIIDKRQETVEVNPRGGIPDLGAVERWCKYQAKPTKSSIEGNLSYWVKGPDGNSQWSEDHIIERWEQASARIEGSTGICDLELVRPLSRTDGLCGYEEDLNSPIKKHIGYHRVRVVDRSCGVERRTLPNLSSRATFYAAKDVDPASFRCSTADDLPFDAPEHVKAKAQILNKALLASLRLDSSQCPYKRALIEYSQAVIDNAAGALTSSQITLLKAVGNAAAKNCGP